MDFNKLDMEIKENLEDEINIINKYMDYRLKIIDETLQMFQGMP